MSASDPAPLYAVKVRRDYNSWVARESLEDFALRYTPHSFRRWSPWRVAHTALGGAAAFLVLEAVGAAMLTAGGFVNAAWAILAVGLVILLVGLPISVYAARYGVDMDLLTRGAGFGYLGSTVTSLLSPPSPLFSSRWKPPSWRMRWSWGLACRRPGVICCAQWRCCRWWLTGSPPSAGCKPGPSRCGWACCCCLTASCWRASRRR
ncbi:hypothetical protein JOS77_25520 [Chromobacterium haemolyticum]|nr:hypothetical protein JOS77_25520 [Chromobacterium haemolyticum]